MQITIPVKSYTLKFLQFYLGKNYQMRMDDPYGLHLFCLVTVPRSKGQRAGQLGRYTAKFTVEVSQHKMAKSGYKGLTNLTTIYFNNFVEAIFKQEFHSLAATYSRDGYGGVQQALDEFMGKFDLTSEDIDPMSLRRSYIRYRKLDAELRKLAQKVA